MSFPKNKRRTIVVAGQTYEWCFTNGTLSYKNKAAGSKLITIALPYAGAVKPADVKDFILENRLPVPVNRAEAKKDFEKARLEDRAKFKLYVWEGVLTDWSDGIMFAYARSLKEAREQIIKSVGYESVSVKRDLAREPDHVLSGKSKGFVVWGGG